PLQIWAVPAPGRCPRPLLRHRHRQLRRWVRDAPRRRFRDRGSAFHASAAQSARRGRRAASGASSAAVTEATGEAPPIPIRVVLVGLGKIACDQHLSALAKNPSLELVASVDPAAQGRDGLPHFTSLDALFQSDLAFDAAAVCTPPQVRSAIALRLLEAGKHVLLEKPPAATVEEISHLEERAATLGVTLFTAWHSRYAAGVRPAREWLGGKQIRSVAIVWREDVHIWHPRQPWIWRPGGFGVFDPGINALSIATEILPHPLRVTHSALQYPA